MESNRRNWLKQAGILIAGAGLGPIGAFASPAAVTDFVFPGPDNGPIRLSSNENPLTF